MPRPSAKRHHNLPAHRVRLIGREQDLVSVRHTLLQAEGRLVTLTGTGGSGKTRLALGLASTLVEEFIDGVWLVELAPLTDPSLVPQAIATTLGVRERAGEQLATTLIKWIGARRLLLVLDNCEHVIDASAGVVERLLDGCANLRVLSTSREPLRIAGEETWVLPSLAVPDARAEPSRMATYPAVELFAERARTVRPDFALADGNARTVATICRRLEGIPLAIELAAARARILEVDQILARLHNNLDVLAGGSRTAPTRQQTMRATVDWSFGLLSAAEQALFLSLAVFAESASLEAVDAVCSGNGPDSDVLDTLDRLIDKSLVRVLEREGRARYRLLEPVRQYALERLIATAWYSDVRQRHLLFCISYGEQREPDANIGGPRRLAAMAELNLEYPNVRLALAWTVESQQAHLGLRLARTVQFFWEFRVTFRRRSGDLAGSPRRRRRVLRAWPAPRTPG